MAALDESPGARWKLIFLPAGSGFAGGGLLCLPIGMQQIGYALGKTPSSLWGLMAQQGMMLKVGLGSLVLGAVLLLAAWLIPSGE